MAAKAPPIRTISAGRALTRHLRDEQLLPVYLITTKPEPPSRNRNAPLASADPGELNAPRRQIEDMALTGNDRSVDHAAVDYADDNGAWPLSIGCLGLVSYKITL
jgi:hypothetical protein